MGGAWGEEGAPRREGEEGGGEEDGTPRCREVVPVPVPAGGAEEAEAGAGEEGPLEEAAGEAGVRERAR